MDISNSELLIDHSEARLKCFTTLVLKGEIRFIKFTCFVEEDESINCFQVLKDFSCHTTATSDQPYLIS